MAGEYEEALSWLKKVHRVKPRFVAGLRLLAAVHALKGEETEAEQVAEELLSVEPGFSISQFMAWYPLKEPETRERLILGLSLAGLPR